MLLKKMLNPSSLLNSTQSLGVIRLIADQNPLQRSENGNPILKNLAHNDE